MGRILRREEYWKPVLRDGDKGSGRVKQPFKQWQPEPEPERPTIRTIKLGEMILCQQCGGYHAIDTEGETGSLWYHCGENLFLAQE